jgi:hypothetical protein
MSDKELPQQCGECFSFRVTVHELFASPGKLEAQERFAYQVADAVPVRLIVAPEQREPLIAALIPSA